MTAANETEAAPLSVDEMRAVAIDLDPRDFERCVATAAALERVTKWILERDAERTLTPERERVREAFCGLIARDAAAERDAGVKPIQALETLGEALADPSDYYDGEACMEACRLACQGRDGIEAHLVASAIQYLWRSGRKGPALPDLFKARDMVERLVREAGGGK